MVQSIISNDTSRKTNFVRSKITEKSLNMLRFSRQSILENFWVSLVPFILVLSEWQIRPVSHATTYTFEESCTFGCIYLLVRLAGRSSVLMLPDCRMVDEVSAWPLPALIWASHGSNSALKNLKSQEIAISEHDMLVKPGLLVNGNMPIIHHSRCWPQYTWKHKTTNNTHETFDMSRVKAYFKMKAVRK